LGFWGGHVCFPKAPQTEADGGVREDARFCA